MQNSLEDVNQLKQEITHWEKQSCHLQDLLDQKDSFLQDLLSGPNHTLLHNLLKDVQYWRERHARLTQFVDHAMEDLQGLLKEDFATVFPHNVPWVIFLFIFVCRVVFERLKVELVVAHREDL